MKRKRPDNRLTGPPPRTTSLSFLGTTPGRSGFRGRSFLNPGSLGKPASVQRRIRPFRLHPFHRSSRKKACLTASLYDAPTSHVNQISAVSYTHLRAHETPEHLVCRLL